MAKNNHGGPRANSGGARQGSGRKVGAATKISRKKADEICKSGKSPLDVMFNNMMFWFEHVQTLSDQLRSLIVDAENEAERAEGFKLLRELLAARQNAQACAVDMAPYCHPRLQSVAFKSSEADLDQAPVPVDQVEASRAYQKLIGSL